MRAFVMIVVALGLAACTPDVPDSGGGIGFKNYNTYLTEKTQAAEAAAAADAQLGAQTAAKASARAAADANAADNTQSAAETVDGFWPANAAAAIDRADGLAPEPIVPAPIVPEPQSDTRARGNAPEGIKQESGEMGYVTEGVSDEQDFGAVSARETIESDKARIAKNRATYTVDQPEALPQRSGDGGPSIVEFALATSHPPGTAMYRRSALRITSVERACGRYTSPDLAQEAFLASGGPDRDLKGLDPDGDGYACSWDPRPFRTALQ